MNKEKQKENLTMLLRAVDVALSTNGHDHVDVVLNEETGKLYVAYHSDNNSYPLSDEICDKNGVDLKKLAKELDKRKVGHCW